MCLPAGFHLPVPHSTPIAGRLSRFKNRWSKIAGPWHQDILENGIPLDWINDTPPPDNRPFDSARSLSPSDFEACSLSLQHQIDIGAVEELPVDTVDGHWSSFFPVPKKNSDKVRGCFDLRVPNRHIQYEHFKMEGLHTAQSLIRRRDVMTKVDISDFFMHKPIGPPNRRYFRFMYDGRKFQYTAMPFGLCSAPRIATKFLQPAIRRLRRMGIRLVVFIDDILILSRSHHEAIRNTQKVVNFLHNLGYSIHPDKITAMPTRSLEFLGIQINTSLMQFRVPPSKVRSLRHQILQVLRADQQGTLTLRRFSSLIGKLNFLSGAVVSARIHIWPLLHLQASVLRRGSSWDGKMSLSSRVLAELEWWTTSLRPWNGCSFIPRRHSHVLTTDASHLGWGGWWRTQGSLGSRRDEARGFFSKKESKMSSNGRELTAVLFSLQSARSALQGKTVLLETDNSTTIAYVNHYGGPSRYLSAIARKLWAVCFSYDIHLQATHRPGVDNQRADRLSRWHRDSTDFKLAPLLFRQADRRWGPHSVDLFANRLNRQCRRFVSWRPDPSAVFIDALQFPLQGENPWCFPPEALISRFLALVIRQQATVTLVAPLWPSRPWWPTLQQLRIDKPMILPTASWVLSTVGLNEFSEFRHLRLAVWRISGSPSRIAAYLARRSL